MTNRDVCDYSLCLSDRLHRQHFLPLSPSLWKAVNHTHSLGCRMSRLREGRGRRESDRHVPGKLLPLEVLVVPDTQRGAERSDWGAAWKPWADGEHRCLRVNAEMLTCSRKMDRARNRGNVL
ncbi:hypothetical protein XELAEV_18031006mg [Xenopus laevis]|uniref:Uncharacterized protein n=1 Tax=Xenopus laevis TaxID=8355 RepID=A0A974CLS4_XENLA|nr:hypothetical protein XELAEV_18031006mg [Xenopus laevis]